MIVSSNKLPDIRLSIRKDGDRWTVTTIKGAYSNHYSVSQAWEITDPGGLLEELLGKGCCHLCGAPLWDVNGHVCCSQHWKHYPQPQSLVDKCRCNVANRWSGYAWEGHTSAPGIFTHRVKTTLRLAGLPLSPEQRACNASWAKFWRDEKKAGRWWPASARTPGAKLLTKRFNIDAKPTAKAHPSWAAFFRQYPTIDAWAKANPGEVVGREVSSSGWWPWEDPLAPRTLPPHLEPLRFPIPVGHQTRVVRDVITATQLATFDGQTLAVPRHCVDDLAQYLRKAATDYVQKGLAALAASALTLAALCSAP